ncbi:MAG: hypothetical protein ACHQAY_27690 [Hyphomicrobiales bacterium]
MSISGIGSGSASLINLYQQRQQDLKNLENAVQSGDITSAQQMLATYQQDGQSVQTAQSSTGDQRSGFQQSPQLSSELVIVIGTLQASGASGAQAAAGTSQQGSQSAATGNADPSQPSFLNDLASLIQAVQSGDAVGAQKAVTALQNDAKTGATGGHHHHGGIHSAASDADAAASSATATSSSATTQSSTPLAYGVDETDAQILAIL